MRKLSGYQKTELQIRINEARSINEFREILKEIVDCLPEDNSMDE